MIKQSPSGLELPVVILDNTDEILEFETEEQAEEVRVLFEKNSDSGHRYLIKKI